MRSKKPKVLYDPNLIWTCSLDLSAVEPVIELEKKSEIKTENFLPVDPNLKSDKPKQSEIN